MLIYRVCSFAPFLHAGQTWGLMPKPRKEAPRENLVDCEGLTGGREWHFSLSRTLALGCLSGWLVRKFGVLYGKGP